MWTSVPSLTTHFKPYGITLHINGISTILDKIKSCYNRCLNNWNSGTNNFKILLFLSAFTQILSWVEKKINIIVIVLLIIHLGANFFTLKCCPFNLDQIGCPLLHAIDHLPEHHLRDGLDLPLDGVLELLKTLSQWLVGNHLQVTPLEAVTGVHI
jgi:hypothetical protein